MKIASNIGSQVTIDKTLQEVARVYTITFPRIQVFMEDSDPLKLCDISCVIRHIEMYKAKSSINNHSVISCRNRNNLVNITKVYPPHYRLGKENYQQNTTQIVQILFSTKEIIDVSKTITTVSSLDS